MSLYLPIAYKDLICTSDDDPLVNYPRPLIGWFYRKRLAMVEELLGTARSGKLLDLGYGSGIFLPALARHTEALHGLDIHPKHREVQALLARYGVAADLAQGDIYKLPYADGSFDRVVAVSIFEHLHGIDQAAAEVRRVLKPGGRLVIGSPVKNRFMDLAFKAFMKFDQSVHHPNDHRTIVAALEKQFTVKVMRRFPPLVPFDFGLYFAMELQK